MNDFEGLIPSDYGFKSQRKSAPMAPPKPKTNANTHFPTSKPNNSPIFDDHDTFSRPNRNSSPNDFSNLGGLNDVFSANRSKSTASTNSSSVNFDNDFGSDSGPGLSSLPVFDKPIYDDEDSGSTKYDDIFGSSTSAKKKGDAFDDLLGGIGSKETQSARSKGAQKAAPGFDELLSGFGRGSNSSSSRYSSEAYKKTSQGLNDPFVVLGSNSPSVASSFASFNDPLVEIGNVNNSYKKKADNTSSRGVFGDIDPLDSLGKSVPTFSADRNRRQKDENSLKTGERAFERQSFANGDVSKKSSVTSPDYRGSSKKITVNNHRNSPQSVFEMPSVSSDSHRSVRSASPHGYTSSNFRESNSYGHVPSDENIGNGGFNDIWLTVSEIPLFTQPTAAPPPSRPPPPRPARFSKAESRSFPASNAQKKGSEYSSAGGSMPYIQSQKSESARPGDSFHSSIDELEDFSTGRFGSNTYGSSDVPACEDLETNSVAATAMKEAMDKAEAKFRQAAVSRGRESARASSSREAVQDAQEKKFKEHQERLEHERLQREMEEEERRRREEEERKRAEREREEKEREKRKIERERELARQAVERAAREARERAATEARARAERTAVQKAQAEARERAERAAVQRVQAEARERAAAGAKERAEKAAAEARERARAEAREKETCERAAATAAKASQQSGENDLESFFGTGSRASSAPRPSSTSSDSSTYFQSKPAAGTARTSINPSSNNMKKASSSTNIVEDLSSIFGGPPSSGEFQAVEGESEERRRARLERHQRTQERAAKALAEKNARDLEAQREQAERHRIAETLDADIKRWATGKEGNLRALLATLHYVLWPESGWQPVSLTDLINGAAVKKVYRKATLCIHPDKVQQKGATLQQKYIAEKVFDLLKEAWNKFNSEELF